MPSNLDRWNAFVDDIRAGTTLRDIVSQDVKLDSSNFGLCPFHKEKTPSFTVFGDDNEAYHCFGCKVSGDVFDYVGKRENIGFRGAVEALGDRIGKTWKPASKQDNAEVEKYIQRITEKKGPERPRPGSRGRGRERQEPEESATSQGAGCRHRGSSRAAHTAPADEGRDPPQGKRWLRVCGIP